MNALDEIQQVLDTMKSIVYTQETYDDIKIPTHVPFVLDKNNRPIYDTTKISKYATFKEFMTESIEYLQVITNSLRQELKIKKVKLLSISDKEIFKSIKDKDVINFHNKK